MNQQRGLFVVVEGPSGVGKTTVTTLLHAKLLDRGFPAVATSEPSDSALGRLARQRTDEYRGLTLACLVAADRYHHLERTIRPALDVGKVVICDRYVPTSLVLQQLDGVQPVFLWQLNQYADQPDLTVILTGQPRRSAERAAERGLYSRFHHGGTAVRVAEDRLYRDVAHKLNEAGQTVLRHEVANQPPEGVAEVLLEAVLERLDNHLS